MGQRNKRKRRDDPGRFIDTLDSYEDQYVAIKKEYLRPGRIIGIYDVGADVLALNSDERLAAVDLEQYSTIEYANEFADGSNPADGWGGGATQILRTPSGELKPVVFVQQDIVNPASVFHGDADATELEEFAAMATPTTSNPPTIATQDGSSGVTWRAREEQ